MPNTPLIMFDGIDGSGKSTLAKAFVDELGRSGKTIFNLPEWSRAHGRLPLPEECGAPDIFFSAEPTQVGVGAAIRQELIRNGADYDPRTIAEAYALDRLILYRRLILPLRAAGTLIVADRGISTSLAYQPTTGVPQDFVMRLAGNALALEHPPTLLVIADCEPHIAAKRLTARRDKDDDSIFEHVAFLEKLRARYYDEAFHDVWRSHGTHLIYVHTNIPFEEMKRIGAELAARLHLEVQPRGN